MIADVATTDYCQDTRVYISDAWGHGLIVYDMLKHKSWRIEHDLMKPDRSLINNAHDGIFTVSLSPKTTKLEGKIMKFYDIPKKNMGKHSKLANNSSAVALYSKKGFPLAELK